MTVPHNDLQKITTDVLLRMISAQAAYYCRMLSEGELRACRKTINELQLEILSRKPVTGRV